MRGTFLHLLYMMCYFLVLQYHHILPVHNLVLHLQTLEDSLLGLIFQNFCQHVSGNTLFCGIMCHTSSTCPAIYLDFNQQCLNQSSFWAFSCPMIILTKITTCPFELFQKACSLDKLASCSASLMTLVNNAFSFSALLEDLLLITSK